MKKSRLRRRLCLCIFEFRIQLHNDECYYTFEFVLFFEVFDEIFRFFAFAKRLLNMFCIKNWLVLIITYFYYIFVLLFRHFLKLHRTAEVVSDVGYDDVRLLYHPLIPPGDCESFGYSFDAFGVDCVC